jgi:ferrous iron transport protein A
MRTPRKRKGGGEMFPLGLLVNGESAEVIGGISLMDREPSDCCRMRKKEKEGPAGRVEDMGIRPGKTVEMLNNGGSGALLVKVDEARIAVGRAMAMKIMVRRKG